MPSAKKAEIPPMHSLSPEELRNPLLAVDDFFDFADLDDARELLWTWLKCTVAGNFHKELNSSERAALLSFYERTDKLIEAAWVVRQRAVLPHRDIEA